MLSRLSFPPYDPPAVVGYGHIDQYWNAIMDANGQPCKPRDDRGNPPREAAVDALYAAALSVGGRATFDVPFTYMFEDLLARNPKAKVIMTTSECRSS